MDKNASVTLYNVFDRGCDGRAPKNIIFTSESESERDTFFDNRKDKAYLSKEKQDLTLSSVLSRLDKAQVTALSLLIESNNMNDESGHVGYVIFDDGQFITSHIDMKKRSTDIKDAHFYENWTKRNEHSFTCDKVHRYLSDNAEIKRAMRTSEGLVLVNIYKNPA